MRTKHSRKDKAMKETKSFSQINARTKMADSVSIRPSEIHGVGIFANEDIPESTFIQKTHFKHEEMGWINLVPNNQYNHSELNANCKVELTTCCQENNYKCKELVTLRLIKKDEEILVNYGDSPELEPPGEDWVQ